MDIMERTSAPVPLLDAHGPEIFGWLVATYGWVMAEDIYGAFVEAVVRSAGSFRGDASLRTWGYVLARSAARRHVRALGRRRALFTPLENHPSALDIAERANGSRGAQDRLEAIRGRLSIADRELLVLRVDR